MQYNLTFKYIRRYLVKNIYSKKYASIPLFGWGIEKYSKLNVKLIDRSTIVLVLEGLQRELVPRRGHVVRTRALYSRKLSSGSIGLLPESGYQMYPWYMSVNISMQ